MSRSRKTERADGDSDDIRHGLKELAKLDLLVEGTDKKGIDVGYYLLHCLITPVMLIIVIVLPPSSILYRGATCGNRLHW